MLSSVYSAQVMNFPACGEENPFLLLPTGFTCCQLNSGPLLARVMCRLSVRIDKIAFTSILRTRIYQKILITFFAKLSQLNVIIHT